MTQWMTAQEAAEYLRLKPGTLAKWRQLSSRGVQVGPMFSAALRRDARYRKDDLDAWMNGGMAQSTAVSKALRAGLREQLKAIPPTPGKGKKYKVTAEALAPLLHNCAGFTPRQKMQAIIRESKVNGVIRSYREIGAVLGIHHERVKRWAVKDFPKLSQELQ